MVPSNLMEGNAVAQSPDIRFTSATWSSYYESCVMSPHTTTKVGLRRLAASMAWLSSLVSSANPVITSGAFRAFSPAAFVPRFHRPSGR